MPYTDTGRVSSRPKAGDTAPVTQAAVGPGILVGSQQPYLHGSCAHAWAGHSGLPSPFTNGTRAWVSSGTREAPSWPPCTICAHQGNSPTEEQNTVLGFRLSCMSVFQMQHPECHGQCGCHPEQHCDQALHQETAWLQQRKLTIEADPRVTPECPGRDMVTHTCENGYSV